MTHIIPKEVTAPAGATTTVTIQVAGVTNSANGPGVLSTTLQKGGMVSQHDSTVTDFFPMQSADCGVSYPSTVNTPWPVTSTGVVSADLTGASRRRHRPGRDHLRRGRPRRPSVRLEDRRQRRRLGPQRANTWLYPATGGTCGPSTATTTSTPGRTPWR